jgi:hypothetical protein
MKKLANLMMLVFALTSLSFRPLECNEIHINEISQPREQAVRAHVQMRNEWVSGYVYITNGLVTRCQFPDIQAGGNVTLRAHIYQPIQPYYLNPNNPIAINNNFTHYVDISGYGRAYFNM